MTKTIRALVVPKRLYIQTVAKGGYMTRMSRKLAIKFYFSIFVYVIYNPFCRGKQKNFSILQIWAFSLLRSCKYEYVDEILEPEGFIVQLHSGQLLTTLSFTKISLLEL